MRDSIEDHDIEHIPAEEAFSILGNSTRMNVLLALWEAEGACTFTELRDQVAPEDTGNFSYHLDRLTGHFLRSVDDGYELRLAGEQVVRAVVSGTMTSDPSIPPSETGAHCPFCDAPMDMAYEEEIISITCSQCDGVIGRDYPEGAVVHFEFPPSGLQNRDRGEVVDAAHVYYDGKLTPMVKGVCPECAGSITIEHDVCRNHEQTGLCGQCETRFAIWSTFTCEYCRYTRKPVMWFAALHHPGVIAFLYQHGLEETFPFRKLTSENADLVRDISGEVAQTDPLRFHVTVPVERSILRVVLDEELDVQSLEHMT